MQLDRLPAHAGVHMESSPGLKWVPKFATRTYFYDQTPFWTVDLPLLVPIVICGAPAVVAWRRHRDACSPPHAFVLKLRIRPHRPRARSLCPSAAHRAPTRHDLESPREAHTRLSGKTMKWRRGGIRLMLVVWAWSGWYLIGWDNAKVTILCVEAGRVRVGPLPLSPSQRGRGWHQYPISQYQMLFGLDWYSDSWGAIHRAALDRGRSPLLVTAAAWRLDIPRPPPRPRGILSQVQLKPHRPGSGHRLPRVRHAAPAAREVHP